MNSPAKKLLTLAAVLGGLFLGLRYLLPLFFPFLLALILALGAEPAVGFLCRRLRLPRPLAAGIGVGLSFAFLVLALLLLGALALKQLQQLTQALPELAGNLRGGMQTLSARLQTLAGKMPGDLSRLLQERIRDLFSGGSALLDRIGPWLLQLASGILRQAPGRALSFATAVIASFMISARLPRLKQALRRRAQGESIRAAAAALGRLRRTLGCWLKAQLKLSAVTFTVASLGLLLLRLPRALLWGAVIALVDAFPILGTGAVLIPWSLISFLQGDISVAFGLLGLYAAAAVTRTVLEPRLVGKQLGLDPLVTLMALYTGFRLFGIGGLILAPVIAVTVTGLLEPGEGQL